MLQMNGDAPPRQLLLASLPMMPAKASWIRAVGMSSPEDEPALQDELEEGKGHPGNGHSASKGRGAGRDVAGGTGYMERP